MPKNIIIVLIYHRQQLLDLACYLPTMAESSLGNVLNKNRAIDAVQKASNCIKLN
jgi:hypothetical protein